MGQAKDEDAEREMTYAEREMKAESKILRETIVMASRLGHRLFRQNTGKGWIGHVIRRKKNEITICNPRRFISGVKGMSDLIGWTSITVTPDMVGRTVAIYTAIETKSDRGRATKEQQAYIDTVLRAGGIAALVKKGEDYRNAIDGFNDNKT